MIALGIILFLIGSVINSWAVTSYMEPPANRPQLFTPAISGIVLVVSISMGIISSVIFAAASSWLVGVATFILFWILSPTWWPLIKRMFL